jgi:rhamnosyltransferase subunit B
LAKTIVLATFGSLGDLHPYVALALGLQERGCRAVIATHEVYRARVESAGLGFRPLRPDYDPTDRKSNAQNMHKWRGTERILREGVLPYLRDTYDDLLAAVHAADVLVSHSIVFPAPIVASQTGIQWVSTVLAPIAFMSAYDPPHSLPAPWMNRVWSFGPSMNRIILKLMQSQLNRWCEPIHELRRTLGLSRGTHDIWEAQHSPHTALAVFSRAIGQPQPDWPAQTIQTGFLFYDQPSSMPADLEQFLDAGPPPIVFTLGSAAVINPGRFFTESAKAIERLGRRAVFLVGGNDVPAANDRFVTAYAPFSQLFPRAAAVVHQGGIGTTAQCLRAGRPALIVPFAHDQPDNAARVKRIGAGSSLPLDRYSAPAVAARLATLEACREGAKRAAEQIAREDGVAAACDAILQLD